MPKPFTTIVPPSFKAASETYQYAPAVRIGDRVAYAAGGLGSYAQYDVVKAAQIAPLPDGVSFHDGAAIILQGITAHYLVHESYPIKRGSTVLEHAVAGGMRLPVASSPQTFVTSKVSQKRRVGPVQHTSRRTQRADPNFSARSNREKWRTSEAL